MTSNHQQRSGDFTVRSTTVSIVLLCVSVSCLASLVVVATITQVDALSTVALALAVLSFAAQLIVTLAQAQSSATQTRETFAINAETRAVLAELQAQGSALVSIQAGQFDKVLDRAINAYTVGTALSNSSEREGPLGDEQAVDPEAFAAELRSLIERSLKAEDQPRNDYPATMQAGQRNAYSAVKDFQGLSRSARDTLMSLIVGGAQELTMTVQEDSPKLPIVQELRDAGFLKWKIDGEWPRRIYLAPKARLIRELLDVRNPAIWVRSLRRMVKDALEDGDEARVHETSGPTSETGSAK